MNTMIINGVETTPDEFVKALFQELYAILFWEETNPDESCFAITSVETDLLAIVEGSLSSKERPFLDRLVARLEDEERRLFQRQAMWQAIHSGAPVIEVTQ